jgi:hypothetical protein
VWHLNLGGLVRSLRQRVSRTRYDRRCLEQGLSRKGYDGKAIGSWWRLRGRRRRRGSRGSRNDGRKGGRCLFVVAQHSRESDVARRELRRGAAACLWRRRTRPLRNEIAERIGLRCLGVGRSTAQRQCGEHDTRAAERRKRNRHTQRNPPRIVVLLKLLEVSNGSVLVHGVVSWAMRSHPLRREPPAANFVLLSLSSRFGAEGLRAQASSDSCSAAGRSIRSGALMPTNSSAPA